MLHFSNNVIIVLFCFHVKPNLCDNFCCAFFNPSILRHWTQNLALLPPELPQRLAQLCVMQVWMLIGQFPARRLRPHHEGVHGPLYMRLVLASGVHSHWHWHDGPVVAVEYLTHRIPDFDRETLVLVVGLGGWAAGGGPGQMRLMWPEQGRVSASSCARGVTRRKWATVIRHPRTEVSLRKALLLSGHLPIHTSLQVYSGVLVANPLYLPWLLPLYFYSDARRVCLTVFWSVPLASSKL